MKKLFKIIATAFMMALLLTVPHQPSYAQAAIVEAVREASKKVIKAVDLMVQRLQNGVIDLQNVQKEIENELSKLKLGEISDWTKKQKDLYQQYFDELWKVKTAITYYKRISGIIAAQSQLVTEYKQAFTLSQQDKNFSPKEIDFMQEVYTGIIDESIKNVDQIINLLKSFTVQMSDAERLKIINDCAEAIENQISELREFNAQNIQLSLQRARGRQELTDLKKLYGL